MTPAAGSEDPLRHLARLERDCLLDIDLLVVTAEPLPPATAEQLVNETYPLYLECGHQIGPQFRSAGELSRPRGGRAAAFAENLARDGIDLAV